MPARKVLAYFGFCLIAMAFAGPVDQLRGDTSPAPAPNEGDAEAGKPTKTSQLANAIQNFPGTVWTGVGVAARNSTKANVGREKSESAYSGSWTDFPGAVWSGAEAAAQETRARRQKDFDRLLHNIELSLSVTVFSDLSAEIRNSHACRELTARMEHIVNRSPAVGRTLLAACEKASRDQQANKERERRWRQVREEIGAQFAHASDLILEQARLRAADCRQAFLAAARQHEASGLRLVGATHFVSLEDGKRELGESMRTILATVSQEPGASIPPLPEASKSTTDDWKKSLTGSWNFDRAEKAVEESKAKLKSMGFDFNVKGVDYDAAKVALTWRFELSKKPSYSEKELRDNLEPIVRAVLEQSNWPSENRKLLLGADNFRVVLKYDDVPPPSVARPAAPVAEAPPLLLNDCSCTSAPVCGVPFCACPAWGMTVTTFACPSAPPVCWTYSAHRPCEIRAEASCWIGHGAPRASRDAIGQAVGERSHEFDETSSGGVPSVGSSSFGRPTNRVLFSVEFAVGTVKIGTEISTTARTAFFRRSPLFQEVSPLR